MQFKFPDPFIQRVKTAFPNDTELHTMLDAGSVWCVERYLEKSGRQDLYTEAVHIFQAWLSSRPSKIEIGIYQI